MSDHVGETVDRRDPASVALPRPADPVGEEREALVAQLVEEAQAKGVSLVGPGWVSERVDKAGPRAGP